MMLDTRPKRVASTAMPVTSAPMTRVNSWVKRSSSMLDSGCLRNRRTTSTMMTVLVELMPESTLDWATAKTPANVSPAIPRGRPWAMK